MLAKRKLELYLNQKKIDFKTEWVLGQRKSPYDKIFPTLERIYAPKNSF